MKEDVFLVCIVVVLFLVLFACDGDGGGYNFIDQDLKGMIDGVSWTYEGTENGGRGAEDFSEKLSIQIYSVAAGGTGPCDFLPFPVGSRKVLFTIPVPPDSAVGLYELGWDVGQTVTLNFDGSSNTICSEGAVEILSVDIGGGLITGRMDATFDADNSVNGNFTVTYCP